MTLEPPTDGATDEVAGASRLVVDVERLVAGGDGLARPADRPIVFVRGALPGEQVAGEVVEVRRGYDRVELTEVLVAAPERVPPPCPAVAAGCGGCDLQHVAPASQPVLKTAVVADALFRQAGISDVIVVAGPALPAEGFRTTVRAAIDHGRAGFRRHRSHEVVRHGSCLVAHPRLEELIRDGRFGDAREVTLRVGAATGERLALVEPTAHDVELPDDVVVVGADEIQAGRRAWIHEVAAGRRWRISATSFFQSRPDGAEALVEAVLRAAGPALRSARVVDAYAGVGLLSAAVVDAAAKVVAVERSSSAVTDAKVNLDGLPVRVVRAPVERWRPTKADVVVADPARTGLGAEAVDVLVGTGASVIVLVSCDAAAFGRDAALLVRHGLRLERAEVVDLFPHSHHVEVVSRFVR
jgi:23S rRNA (uracil1939-C5)-methyltransferase